MLERYLKPLRVGKVEFSPRLILAPMSGVTNSAFRRLMRRRNGAALGLVVTEFISIEGLTRFNRKTMGMMGFHEEERPLAIQIFGYDIERMVDAARMAEDAGADIVDINSGCPVPKVVRRGGGCELMRQPGHLAKMLAATARAISCPLTLKIRSGWDSDSKNAVEIATLAEESGVQMLTVHGRTRVQLYRDFADWDLIEAVQSAISIPVVGSGDVMDGASALNLGKRNVAALMLGRGALENPWVFRDVQGALSGLEPERRRPSMIIDVLEEYMALLLEIMHERGAIGKMKQMSSQVTRCIPGSAEIRRSLCRAQTLAEMRAILVAWRDRCDLLPERYVASIPEPAGASFG